MDGQLMPERWMERLFARLSSIYGNRMTTMWADCPKADLMDAWREGLRGIEADSIALALSTVHVAHPEWPPTLGEFVSLCKPQPVTAAHRLLPSFAPRKHGPIAPEIQAKIDEFLGRHRVA